MFEHFVVVGTYSGRFSGLVWPPPAPGWPETDSPRNMMATSGVETKIRAVGTRFVVIFHFWETIWSTTLPPCPPPLDASQISFLKLDGPQKNLISVEFRCRPALIIDITSFRGRPLPDSGAAKPW